MTLDQLKVFVVSNEGRELNDYRIRTFQLASFVDCFVSSCFVHLRKPDEEIYRLALDLAHVEPTEVAYLEDRPMFVQVEMPYRMIAINRTTIGSMTTIGPAADCRVF